MRSNHGFALLVVALLTSTLSCASAESAEKQRKVLNSFVTELLNVELPDARPRAEHAFVNDRSSQGGWVFVSSTAEIGDGGKVLILIDSEEEENAVIIHEPKSSKLLETIRFLPAGKHRLIAKSSGAARLKHLIVRSIPESFYGNFGYQIHVPQYGPFDWEFLKKSGMLDNITTIISGRDTAERIEEFLPHVKEWKGMGRRWVVETGVPSGKSGEATAEFWSKNVGFQHPLLDGVIVDEFVPSRIDQNKDAYAFAIKKLSTDFKGKRFIAYSGGTWSKPESYKPLVDILRECGYSWAPEAYMGPEVTREKTKWGIEELHFARYLHNWKHVVNVAPEEIIIVLGLLSEPPETLCQYPNVDFKVFMDMEFNFIANDRRFSGLGGIHDYYVSYASDETIRWLAKLYRHYCIEGRTEPLSKDPFTLTHIENGDFDNGTERWTAAPAEEGSIAVKTVEGLSSVEGRYPKTTQGDTCLWMRRSDKGPNTVSQEIKGLQAGKYYSFRMFSGDLQNLGSAEKVNLSIEIEGVELIPQKCFQHVFKNPWHGTERYPINKVWLNYYVKVFRAVASEAKLVISDWVEDNEPGAPTGRETIFNFVQVRPYLED